MQASEHAVLTPGRRRLWPWLAGALLVAAWALAARSEFDLVWLQQQRQQLLDLQAAQPWCFGLAFFALFTLLSALAMPGCGLLALAAGLCFGWVAGTALVVLASTVGATLSFLAGRHLLRDAVRRRWGRRLAVVEEGLARDGAFYLFSLRLAPVIPYALVNPLMGVSDMSTRQFFVVSLLGMLAGSAAYVYAGTALSQAQSWQDVLSPSLMSTLIAALFALALLPWLARALWRAAR